jgi:hypothetical protein
MLRVKETLEVSIPLEGLDAKQVEEVVARETREFRKRLMISLFRELERVVLEKKGRRVVKKGRVERYLCTRFGWIRYERQKVRDEEEEGKRHGFPLDEALGLRPHQEETEWVRKRGVELACDHPYRQAAGLLGEEIGEVVSHRTLHRWVQEQGGKLGAEEEEVRRRVFEVGDTLEQEEGQEREIVVVEVDGTMLASQDNRGQRFEVKLGLMYTGKELESKEAKHKRYRLKEKVLYGGVEEAQAFGEKLYLKGEQNLHLGGARHLLFIGDGARWINDIAGAHYWKSVYQLDWWHYQRKLRQALPGEEELIGELLKLLREGEGEKHRRLLRLRRLKDQGETEKQDELIQYLEDNWKGLYGSWSLRGKVRAQEVLVVGSGAVEKNIELVIGRRFKKRGMSWSRAGANNLLKLRIRRQDRAAWEAWWQRRAA